MNSRETKHKTINNKETHIMNTQPTKTLKQTREKRQRANKHKSITSKQTSKRINETIKRNKTYKLNIARKIKPI